MLSAAQLAQYHQNGFLVIEDFKTAAECQQLIARAGEIVDAFEPDTHSVFSTTEQQRTADEFFLSSGDKIRCFFEEEALDETGQLVVDKSVSINKLGHAMHELDPVFRAFTADDRLAEISQQLEIGKPEVLQSMYIFKQPEIGGEVTVHQDSTFLQTKPLSCVGFWFALEDATLENGCLWGLPEGHKLPLEKVMKRKESGEGVEFEALATLEIDQADLVALPVKAGSMIMFDGNFPHMSFANRSKNTRHAFTLHVIDGEAEYPAYNWLQREDGKSFPTFQALALMN